MSEPNDLRERLDKQHALVLMAQENATAAVLLASRADRDVADVNTRMLAQTSVLNALRETQVEHGQHIKEHGRQLVGLRTEVAEVKADVSALKADMSTMKADMGIMKADICGLKGGLDEITTLLRRRPKDA